jgi:hypothetical protein
MTRSGHMENMGRHSHLGCDRGVRPGRGPFLPRCGAEPHENFGGFLPYMSEI